AQIAWQQKWHDKLSAGWSVLKPEKVESQKGTTFEINESGVVRADGPNPEQDVHEVTVKVEPGTIAALRLETLPDESLPKKSSARAEDGRFRLSEFQAELAPAKDDDKAKAKKLKFSQAIADASEAT